MSLLRIIMFYTDHAQIIRVVYRRKDIAFYQSNQKKRKYRSVTPTFDIAFYSPVPHLGIFWSLEQELVSFQGAKNTCMSHLPFIKHESISISKCLNIP